MKSNRYGWNKKEKIGSTEEEQRKGDSSRESFSASEIVSREWENKTKFDLETSVS